MRQALSLLCTCVLHPKMCLKCAEGVKRRGQVLEGLGW